MMYTMHILHEYHTCVGIDVELDYLLVRRRSLLSHYPLQFSVCYYVSDGWIADCFVKFVDLKFCPSTDDAW